MKSKKINLLTLALVLMMLLGLTGYNNAAFENNEEETELSDFNRT